MKVDTWRKWVRRSVILALGVCMVTGVTGCFDDDDDLIPTTWEVSWLPDETGESPVTILWDVDDLTAVNVQVFDEMFGDYHVRVNPGPPVVITIDDTAGNFYITLTSVNITPTHADGNYSGTSSNNNPINGTWSIDKN